MYKEISDTGAKHKCYRDQRIGLVLIDNVS